MLELKDLKTMHDKAYNGNTVTRERAADDSVFAWVTQWDDNLLGETQLQYRGEFNILRKAMRQIISDLRSNPVQVDFEPTISGRDESADLLDGMYRSDDRVNVSQESYDNASMEAVVCGVGAWELHTEWKSNRIGDERQVIRRRPLYEANNNVFWDPNAKLMDKSDAGFVSILDPYTKEGYKDLVEELTGRDRSEIDVGVSSFKTPEESYSFPWAAGNQDHVYVSTFYHREKIKDKVIKLEDPLGQEMTLLESDLCEMMDELIDEGYSIDEDDTRKIERWAVTKYIASGAEILDSYEIPGQYIPVVPQYGERAFVEGEEHWEGVTRLAKDPQRLRNFQMSYLADIVSQSPRPKPIFYAGQIGQFRSMYEEAGSDNNYPYYLMEEADANGNQYPLQPGLMPEQQIPQALMTSIDLSRQAVEDVANPGVPQDIADTDLSGKAVQALQNRLDQQSLVYQQNRKHALRRDAEIYASMASVINDCPCEVTLTMADGSRKKCQMMEPYMDEESGDMMVRNDLTNLEFEVFADIGTPYASQKEQTLEKLGEMSVQVAQTDPAMANMLVLEQLNMMDGVAMKNIREYANKQMILSGYKQPETPEEEQILAEAQQGQQPDANMIAAQAMDKEAGAKVMREQTNQFKVQNDAENNNAGTEIDRFRATTDRLKVQVDTEVANAELDFKRADAMTKRIAAVSKQSLRTSATPPVQAYG